MDKIIEVPFGAYYLDKFSRPLRNKKDFIFLLLDTLNILCFDDFEKVKAGTAIIKVDKMSRIFYHLNTKIFSVLFPFHIEENVEEEKRYHIFDIDSETEIDSKNISLMRSILKRIDYDNTSIEMMLEKIYFEITDEGYWPDDLENCWKIILKLFSMELGYIRFDHDPEHEKGKIHPLNHLDINYSSNCTYKLGTKTRLGMEEFIDLLDIKTDCRFVV